MDKSKYPHGFAWISVSLIISELLNYQCLGLLCLLLSLPPNWKYSLSGIAKCSRDSRKTTERVLRKLTELGHFLVLKERSDNGKFLPCQYVVRETPSSTDEPASNKSVNTDSNIRIVRASMEPINVFNAEVLRDPHLSLRAKGVYVMWIFFGNAAKNHKVLGSIKGKEKADAVLSALNELRRANWIPTHPTKRSFQANNICGEDSGVEDSGVVDSGVVDSDPQLNTIESIIIYKDDERPSIEDLKSRMHRLVNELTVHPYDVVVCNSRITASHVKHLMEKVMDNDIQTIAERCNGRLIHSDEYLITALITEISNRTVKQKATNTQPCCNSFNDFEQRDYDYDELERRLLAKGRKA